MAGLSRIVHELQRQVTSSHGNLVLVATDGGAMEPRRHMYRTGAFAIAVERGDGLEPIVTHRNVGGLDQTSLMAELQGAIVASHSAVEAQTPVPIIIDNLSVQRGVAARLRGEAPQTKYCGKLWRMVEQAGKALPGCVWEWVPVQSRHTDWRAPGGGRKESQRWRDRNVAADDAASSAAEQVGVATWNL